MAADLAATPSSGLKVQLCGDAHLSNFGVFEAPDRSLVFDVNDFDETRAHARSGDRIAIAAYLGGGTAFEEALARFAEAYADQNERDHRAFAEAIKSGRLQAELNVSAPSSPRSPARCLAGRRRGGRKEAAGATR